MPPNSKADLAHPEAADWVLGAMGPAQAEDFPRHLTGCLHCQAAVAEFGELGQMLQHLPPAAEPPPGLEARTIASVLAAAAKYPAPKADRRSDPEDQAATRVQPRPQLQPPAGDETRVQPRPQLQPPAGDETRVQPRPQLQPPAGDETRVQPRPQLQPPAGTRSDPAETAAPASGRGRDPSPASGRAGRDPAGGHSAACVATLSRPPRCCSGRRSCHHHCRHRHPAQPWRGPDHLSRSHSRDPAPCHHGGQADRRRRSHRASDGPAGWPKLDLRYDRPWPQGPSRQ